MKNRLIATLVAGVLSASAWAAPAAVVNGTEIPQERLDGIVRQLAARGEKDSPELRAALKDKLISAELAYQEAQKRGLEKSPEVQAELESFKRQLLTQALMRDFAKQNPLGDAQLKAEYDRIKAQMSGKEYRARHILVKTEAEAKQILVELKKGKRFDLIASQKSLDSGSKERGGDLGWNVPQGYVKPFGEALMKLAKGQITATPVQTEFGFHIIKLEEVRENKAPAFEEVKPQLQNQIYSGMFEKFLTELRAKATIK